VITRSRIVHDAHGVGIAYWSGVTVSMTPRAMEKAWRRSSVLIALTLRVAAAVDLRLSRRRRLPGGVVHKLPGDLRKALVANPMALGAWNDITPLARNEFICWVEDAKQGQTRERRILRTQEELEEGAASALLLAGMQTPRAHR
jgi:hypothetical protein